MNFKSTEYLPDSGERIEHLRKIIAGRPVAILASGPSIKELEKRINELNNIDICYFGLNNFSVPEAHILQQIDRHFSVTMCSAREHMTDYINEIITFLNRDEDNLFVSSFWRDTFELMGTDFNLNLFLSKYDEKLIFFSVSLERTVPNSNFPLHFILSNSLLGLIQLAIIGKASRIVIFGSDGYCKDTGDVYYNNQCGSDEVRRKSVIYDTNIYFNPIAPVTIRNLYKTYNISPIEILNCSEDSACTPFPNVSYDDAFDCLLKDKKFQREMDLRIPKISVISLCLNTGDFVKETIENISRQSYTNYEHIIVYSETDDKIQDIKQQIPYVRWIPEKNIDYIPALKKAISMARGEYVIQCNIGDGYLHQDWFNTCVEVLENNPDVSLVWGLSQNMYNDGALGQIENSNFFDSPPLQRKKFIYYWLKKKVLFPRGNVCVRKKVLEKCFPFSDSKARDDPEAWIAFNNRFNVLGYQPCFVPIVANYCRTPGVIGEQSTYPDTQNQMKKYCEEIERYKKQLIDRKTAHHYRNGTGELLPYGFNHSIFLFLNTINSINGIQPNKFLNQFEKYENYWMVYRWKILKLGAISCWHRVIKIMK